MKRILVFSWFYPPINSSEGLVTFKLLGSSRFAYDVFTQKSVDTWSYGASMGFPDRGNVRAIYARSTTLADWEREAFRYFAAHRDEYDLIMTRSMPPEVHAVGLRIKKRYPGVGWIASFGDPIKSNPFYHLGYDLFPPFSMGNLRNRRKGLRFRFSLRRIARDCLWRLRCPGTVRTRRRLIRIEDGTIARADRLVFNDRSELRLMARTKAARAKSVLIRHSYDASLFPGLPSALPRDKQRFVFVGQLNFIRKAEPLLRGIRELRDSVEDLAERAEFVFYGDMPESDMAYIVRNGLTELVRYEKPVSYRESLRLMREADWVVHIDADTSAVTEENVFFAGKLADYFGAGTRILAVTMQRGDAVDALRRAGALVLSYSASEIKEYLYLILYQGWQARMDRAYTGRYDARTVAGEFDREVITAMENRKRVENA